MNFQTKNKRISTVPPVPMTDVIFNLLLFFLLTSSFIMQTGIKVNLPKASTNEPASEKNIVVTITKENAIYVDDERVVLSEVKNAIKKRLEQGRKRFVVIKSDKDVELQAVVSVMDSAKDAGITKFMIATQQ